VLIFVEHVELSSAVPSGVADEYLEEYTTKALTTLISTTLTQEKVDVRLAVGLGAFAAVIALAVVSGSICVCIVCVTCRKHAKQ
jgi:uncharacterized membrane protein